MKSLPPHGQRGQPFAQPPLITNPNPDGILFGRLVSFFTFGMLLLTGFVAGSVAGPIYKSKGRQFPWRRILWATLIIAAVFAAILTPGAWNAHNFLTR